MSNYELKEIISHGLRSLNIGINNDIKNIVVEYSSGFPHYTHLLCKYGAESVIQRGGDEFLEGDLSFATRKGAQNSNQQLRNSYRKATIASKQKPKWEEMLQAASKSKTDEYDSFTANDVVAVFATQDKSVSRESVTYYLREFCKTERGNVIEKVGYSKNIRYKFRNPLMKSYVKLKSHERNSPHPDFIEEFGEDFDIRYI